MTRALALTLPLTVVLGGGVVLSAAGAAGGDRPDTRAAARHAAASPTGRWIREALGTDSDKDWFRFSVSRAGRALVTLGHLAGNYSLTVDDAQGRTVAPADRSGRRFEEVYPTLSPGDYFVGIAADSGADATADYALRFRPLADKMVVAEQKEVGDVDGFDIKGEVLNNTSDWMRVLRLHVTWFDRHGRRLGSVNEGIRPGPVAPRQRAEFEIRHKRAPAGDLPAAAASYTIRVDADSTNDRTPRGLVMKPGGAHPQGSARVYSGALTNGSKQTLHQIYPTVIEYDALGRANAIGYDHIRSLAPGASVHYDVLVGNKNVPKPNAVSQYASITKT